MKAVLFLHMPLAVPTVPSLAAELLAAICNRAQIPAHVFYGTFRLRRTPSLSCYIHSIAGAGIFTRWYYEDLSAELSARLLLDSPKAVSELIGNQQRFGREQVPWPIDPRQPGSAWPYNGCCNELLADVLTHIDLAGMCVDDCLADIPAGRYDIYAFSLMFDSQKLPSLCLAKRLKERDPSCHIVFGGTACDGDMGPELLARFPCVDVVAQGEADLTILKLVSALRGEFPLADVPGVLFRQDSGISETGPAPRLASLDTLPSVDYSSFIQQLSESDWRHEQPFILWEGSRGCWWGEKHHCLFCGLRADGLAYRRKSADLVRREVEELGSKYPNHRVLYATDAILDYRAFQDLLPFLIEPARRRQWRLFFELKSNLRKEQVAMLAAAGVSTVQPGIETFSDHILELMDKGNTGLNQVCMLKWLAAYNVDVIYHFILGTPGETVADYEEMLELLPSIRHLPPPTSLNYLSLDKFSPYMKNPLAWNLREVRPDAIYERVFPDSSIDFSKFAYKFQYKSRELDSSELRNVWGELEMAIQTWREEHAVRFLYMIDSGNEIEVTDQRDGVSRKAMLTGIAADLYRFCESPRSFEAIRKSFPRISSGVLRSRLESWRSNGWMYKSRSDRYMALAVDARPQSAGSPEVPAEPELELISIGTAARS